MEQDLTLPVLPLRSEQTRNANRDRSHPAPKTVQLPNTSTMSHGEVVFTDTSELDSGPNLPPEFYDTDSEQ